MRMEGGGITNGGYKGSTTDIDLTTPTPTNTQQTVEVEDGAEYETKGGRVVRQTKDIMQRFCEETSIQGLKQVAESQPYRLRRLFWLALLIFGTVVFFIQFVNSVSYFLSNPVAVNIQVNYNTTMEFPAVTICNQNAFRMTATYKKGWYDMINYWYDKNTKFTSEVIQRKKDLPMDVLYKEGAHNMSDLIVSCRYDQIPCRADKFASRITDYGQCYTFNFHVNPDEKHIMARSGVLGGLQLVLNAEQYEFMDGPNNGAGARVLVHEQEEMPRVRDYGDAVPAGMRAMVAVQRVEVKNLPPKYGLCDKEKEEKEYGGHYSLSICETRCLENYLRAACNCRTHISLYSIKANTDSLPVCTAGDFKCIATKTDKFHQQNIDCQCQPACNEVAFDTSVTYAWMSNYDLSNFLSDDNLQTSLRAKLLEANEISQRARPQHVKSNTDTITRFSSAVDKLDKALLSLLSGLQDMQINATLFISDLEHRVNFHKDRGLGAVKFTYDKDFLRGFQVFEERGINQVTPEFFGTVRTFNLTVNLLLKDMSLGPAERYALYLSVLTETEAKLTMARIAETYVNQTEVALRSGEPLLEYQLTYERRYDMKYLPYTLVNKSENQERDYDELMIDIEQLISALENMQIVSKRAFETRNVSSVDIKEAGDAYESACRGYNYRVFMYRTNVLGKPSELIQERITNFDKLVNNWNQNKQKFFLYSDDLLMSIGERLINSTTWTALKLLRTNLNEYLSDKSMSKLSLMEKVADRHNKEMYSALISELNELAKGVSALTTSATNLMISAKNIWEAMLKEDSTKLAYSALKDDVDGVVNGTADRDYFNRAFAYMLRRHKSSVVSIQSTEFYSLLNADFPDTVPINKAQEIEQIFTDLQNAFDLDSNLHNAEEEFKNTFDDVIGNANKFITSVTVDERFYLNNFLTLDIYMKEMKYQKITQLPAYDITKLLSDIGGSLGLFAGASVFTIVEVFDFFLYQNLIMGRRRKKEYEMNST